jgi:serine/threonine-protein kinase
VTDPARPSSANHDSRRASFVLPEVGDSIQSKYRIDRVIGNGGMGTVYAAHHLVLDETVAIKVIAPEIARSADLSARFLLEARAAARLKSAHVARVLDADMLDDGLLFIVMELLEGRDLSDVIGADGPMPLVDAADIMLEALEGLAHAHAAGLVHRDLKPSNLFLAEQADGSAVVKVLDFGISKSTLGRFGEKLVTLTNAGKLLGSPGYMSPEQMRDSSKVDVRSDVWSMGTVFFEMLTSVRPWEGESASAVFAAVLETEPSSVQKYRRDVPSAVDEIVRKCLRKNVDERYANVGELARALAPYASAEMAPLAARITGILEKRKTTKKSTPVRVADVNADTMPPPPGWTPTSGEPLDVPRVSAIPSIDVPSTPTTELLVGSGEVALANSRASMPEVRTDPGVVRPRRGMWIGLAIAGAAVAVIGTVAIASRTPGGSTNATASTNAAATTNAKATTTAATATATVEQAKTNEATTASETTTTAATNAPTPSLTTTSTSPFAMPFPKTKFPLGPKPAVSASSKLPLPSATATAASTAPPAPTPAPTSTSPRPKILDTPD